MKGRERGERHRQRETDRDRKKGSREEVKERMMDNGGRIESARDK